MTWKFWTYPRLLRNLQLKNKTLAERILELETALACAKGMKARLEKRVVNLNDELNGKLDWTPNRVTTLADVPEYNDVKKS